MNACVFVLMCMCEFVSVCVCAIVFVLFVYFSALICFPGF